MARKRVLHCWWGELRIAELTCTDRNGVRIACRYTPEALARWETSQPVISCSLLVGVRPQDASNFFRGLLPEGQHLQALAGRAGVTTMNTFDLLRRYGRDVAGALVITEAPELPSGYASVEPYNARSLEAEIEGLDDRPLAVYDDSELSIAGIQDKLLLVRLPRKRWGRPVHGYPSTHILKTDDGRHDGLVRAEAGCLSLAHAIGLAPAAPEIVTIAGRDCIMVERYDRVRSDGGIVRVHQEDACQALDIDPDASRGRGKYERHGGPTLHKIAELLRVYADDAEVAMRRLVEHVVFAVAIRNADWHGKNVSLLHADDGTIELAPVYDTVPTFLWSNLRTASAMSVAGVVDFDRITLEKVVAEAAGWGMRRADASDAVDDVVIRMEDQLGVIDRDDLRDAIARQLLGMRGRQRS